MLQTLRENKNNVDRTAYQLGMTPGQVRFIDMVENGKFNYTPEGRGRPELQPYIVGIRDRDSSSTWDNADPKIAKAREYYDQGLIEMVTGIDGMNLILYAIPRQFPDADRSPYFSEIEEE